MVSVNKYIINDNEIFIVAKIEKLCEKAVVVREILGIGEQIRVFADYHRVLYYEYNCESKKNLCPRISRIIAELSFMQLAAGDAKANNRTCGSLQNSF